MSVEIVGLDGVIRAVDNIGNTDNLSRALGKACALVERAAKQKAPKDTGALRRSITSTVEGNKGIVFTPLEYAPYIEFGTGLFAESSGRSTSWSYQDDKGDWHTTNGMKPQPFLRPALHENREQIKRIIKEGLVSND